MGNDIEIFGLPGESDDLGHEEVLGALASAANKIKGTGTLFGQALAAKLARRVPIVHKIPLKKERRWLIGFGPYHIEPGATRKEFVQAKVLFKIEKALGDDTPDLHVLNFWIGQRKQIELHGDSMPLKIFLDKIGTDIVFETVDPAAAMTIEIENRGKEKAVASFSLIGRAIL